MLYTIKRGISNVSLRKRILELLRDSQAGRDNSHQTTFNLMVRVKDILNELEISDHGEVIDSSVGVALHYASSNDLLNSLYANESGLSKMVVMYRAAQWLSTDLDNTIAVRLRVLFKGILFGITNLLESVEDSADKQYIGRIHNSTIIDSIALLELCFDTCNIRSNKYARRRTHS